MTITPQAMHAIKVKVARIEARAAAKVGPPIAFSVAECGADGLLAADLGAMGGGFRIVVIPSEKFLADSNPAGWAPKLDSAAHTEAWAAHLAACAEAAAAGAKSPAFVPPHVVYRIALADAPAPPESLMEARLPVQDAPPAAKVIHNPALEARRRDKEAFRRRFGR
ncbi:hypothetical protein ACWIEX_06005 [Bosea sp. NPDC055353]